MRVGKAKAKPDNFTDTSFKSRCEHTFYEYTLFFTNCEQIIRPLHLTNALLSRPRPHLPNVRTLTVNSHRYQPAIPHDLCTLLRHPIRTLPLPRVFLQVRRPTTRCPILPHHPSFISASQCADTSLHRTHTPQASPADTRWLAVCADTAAKIPTPSPSKGCW